jgi:hypothetical protein
MTVHALRNLHKSPGYVLVFKTSTQQLPSYLSNIGFAISSKTAYRVESLIKYHLNEASLEDALFMKAILSQSKSFAAEIKKINDPVIYGMNVELDEPVKVHNLSNENIMTIQNLFHRYGLNMEIVKKRRYGVNMEITKNIKAKDLVESKDYLGMAFMLSQSCQELSFYDAIRQETIIFEKLM